VKNKITLCIFLLTLFSLMNLYSRALRHINIKDVKQKQQEKVVEQKLKEQKEKEELKYFTFILEKKKYDWRKELKEQMTTSDIFYTNLPATGDTNLEFPNWNILGGQGYNVSGGTLNITGSGNITDGAAASFDTSLYDTLVFNVGISGDTLLGVFPTGAGGPLLVAQSSGTYSITVGQSKSLTLLFVAPGKASGNVSVSNLRLQRRTPINVFVPLDSPEATSFIRSGTGSSAEERQKYVEEMLKAGKEYTNQLFGSDFPGSNAVMPGSPRMEPGVEVSDFDISKMEKNYGEVAGSMNTPTGAIKFMKDLMKDGFGGNEVRTTVNGHRMVGRPAEIIQQINLNFPGGV
jgi:hypothetical protein